MNIRDNEIEDENALLHQHIRALTVEREELRRKIAQIPVEALRELLSLVSGLGEWSVDEYDGDIAIGKEYAMSVYCQSNEYGQANTDDVRLMVGAVNALPALLDVAEFARGKR